MAVPTIVQLPLFVLEKRCTQCGAVKPLEQFVRCRRSRDGRRSVCRPCNAARKKAYTRTHPEAQRAWEQAHQAEIKARHRAWIAAHAEEQRLYRERYYRQNREKIRATYRHTYRRDPQKQLRRSADWRVRHPDKARLFDKKGLAKRRALMRSAEGHCAIADIRALEVAQGGICAYCQEPYGRYHVDHKQPLSRGGTNWPDNLCLACGPCNIAKHDKTEAEYREWLIQR